MYNLKYNFKEANLGLDFAEEKIKEAAKLIQSSVPFTVVGMPTCGISFFIKYLCLQDNLGVSIHIDINELPTLSKSELFKLILKELGGENENLSQDELMVKIKEKLRDLSSHNQRLILAFNRFDRLIKEFDQNFFANLRTLWEVDKEKIILIFTANKPLLELSEEAVSGGNFNLCSKCLYLTPYSSDDLLKLLSINSPNLVLNPNLKPVLELSGGHYQLFILLLKSELIDNPLSDPAIKFQLKELYQFLNYSQRKQLQKISLGKSIKNPDQFLINVGYIKSDKLFTPLLGEYIKSNLRLKLPLQEHKLFLLLKSKLGKIITKDEIYDNLWKSDPDLGSDWALNALIYRLRKNSTFSSSGYIIESHKKQGYSLIKI